MYARIPVAAAAAFAAALLACPPADKEKKESSSSPSPASAQACVRFGQTCEVSPGKLGTCVQKDGCTDTQSPICYVCQSQH